VTGARVEPACPEDAPYIGRILSGWVDETTWLPRVHTPVEEQAFAALLVTRGWVSVVRQNGVATGFLARDGGEIHALYLAQGARGQGLGPLLLDHAKRSCEALDLFTFRANTRAQKFYLREGFREAWRTNGASNDEKLPDIRYHWERAHDEH